MKTCANSQNSSCPKTKDADTPIIIMEKDLSDFSQFNLSSSHLINTMDIKTSTLKIAKIFYLDSICSQGLINFSKTLNFIPILIEGHNLTLLARG